MSRAYVIDGVFFQIGKSGIARVWSKVLEQWLKSGFADQIVVVDRARTMPRVSGIAYHDAPALAHERQAEDCQMLQEICDAYGARAFVSTYYTTPVSTPALMLVHDMIPEVLGWDLGAPMWRQKQQALAYASRFAAVSRNTEQDLRRLAGRRDLEVDITPNGCDFTPASVGDVQSFRERLGLQRPYFLLSGSRSDYKNAGLFFAAFERLGDARSQFEIFCTGGGSIEPLWLQQAGPAQVRVGILSDSDMTCAYTGAVALVYPSLYEGFGLPVLEAMACACPVICSDAASLPEVGGDAPLYIRMGTGDQEATVAQLAQLLMLVQAPQQRITLIERGLRQASGFRWDTLAEALAASLEATASQPVPRGAQRKSFSCRLCGGATRFLFDKQVLHRHTVAYHVCDDCAATTTELPYWLQEAYVPQNEQFDTGQVTRSLINAAVLRTLVDLSELPPATRIVDYGCGSGLLVRVLRDTGLDAWGYDRYSQPRLALGFQSPDYRGFDVINLCEVVEHFDQPREYFDDIFAADPKLVVIQTGIASEVRPEWDYLAAEHGQHIFFLAPRTLQWLCRTYGRVLLNVVGFQVLTTPDLAGRLVDPQTGLLHARHHVSINNLLPHLWQSMFARPYFHAGCDNQLLRHKANAAAS